MTKANIPWFAGVLDARAHFRIESSRGKPQPRLRVTTNRILLLTTMSDMTGTKVRVDDKGYSRRPCADHCKAKHAHIVSQSSYWNADCIRATIILHSCLPFLVSSREEALALLRVGLESYSPSRNGTATAMKKLGWNLPEV